MFVRCNGLALQARLSNGKHTRSTAPSQHAHLLLLLLLLWFWWLCVWVLLVVGCELVAGGW